jgi:hypothetical protein
LSKERDQLHSASRGKKKRSDSQPSGEPGLSVISKSKTRRRGGA